jgi:tetraprenyl-beta-curcumene synthase
VRGAAKPPLLTSAEGFPRAAYTYWLGVFPQVRTELRRLRQRADAIEDPRLRTLALKGLAKRDNMEGAAAFATFVPASQRRAVVRATVAFQAAYNHLDVLSEQQAPEEAERARRAHTALLSALALPGTPHEHIERDRHSDPYLTSLVDTCRGALAGLPSYPTAAPAALRAAGRVVAFQSLNRGYGHGDHLGLQRWSEEHTPAGADLLWWETAASAGSSLGVHAMLAAAASPSLQARDVQALERAYFPWIGALHSLLDQLIDREEDARTAQRNLLDSYPSMPRAAERIGGLARHSLACAADLSPRGRHEPIVAAMASFYLSSPAARSTQALPVTNEVLRVLGPSAKPALAIFQLRRRITRLTDRHPSAQVSATAAPAISRPANGVMTRYIA